jgi:NhaA family Na+:H+ antiporter
MTPVFPLYSEDDYYRRSSWILGRFEMNRAAPNHRERLDYDAMQMAAVARESISPLDRLEHSLTPWSSFVVVPLFALANAGVRFADFESGPGEAVTSPIALGVGLGLLFGKLFGISLATWIAVRLGLGKLPSRTGWPQVFGLAGLAGIGFTVALFVTELAFDDPALADAAKVGIFAGSFIAGVVGYVILRRSKTPDEVIAEKLEKAEPAEAAT